VRRAAHVLLHQQHAARRFDVEPARIEAHALADDRDHRIARLAPGKLDHARRMFARGGAANCVNHRIFAFQHIASRSEEHTSELQSLMRSSYAVLFLKKKKQKTNKKGSKQRTNKKAIEKKTK